ncbi:MAG: DUF1566 domain-containing protein [Sphaerochaetaceae bacterium]|nr:DUF1566 domain-containing protein [Sphaerochaetaceae bacterium]
MGGACNACGEYQVYAIGAAGPAGGIIFYDCDADNTDADPDGADNLKSDVCGWRYLEAAPENITANGEVEFGFGYWRDRSNGTNLKVDTLDGFGAGKKNTADIVRYLGNSAYMYNSSSTGMYDEHYQYNEVKSGDYAARLASNYVYGDYTDWFLPSSSELFRMCNALQSLGLGGFENGDYYWSSTEASTADSAWGYKVGEQSLRNSNRSTTMHVRPVRSF